MAQQDETKRFFGAKADDWQREASDDAATYSVIHHRNRTVLHVLDGLGRGARFLDVGCGSGQLVIEAARRGMRAEGNDFADAMIENCQANRAAAGVAATFHRGSFFDLPVQPEAFDAISALGFIEYLPLDGIMAFFERGFAMLRPGGALIVGSRNRLFNLLSLNAFTLLEAELGTVDALLRESVALQGSNSAEAAFAALRPLERTDPQPESHPEYRNRGRDPLPILPGRPDRPVAANRVRAEGAVPHPLSRPAGRI